MSREEWDETMKSAVSSTLENMAFMEVLPCDEPPESYDNVMQVTLLVHDPTPGEFRMLISRDLVAEIAANILGPEVEELEDQGLNDILSELLNTIIGRFLSEILSDDETFKLGLPEISMEEHTLQDPEAIHWNYMIDEAPFMISAIGGPLLQMCGE